MKRWANHHNGRAGAASWSFAASCRPMATRCSRGRPVSYGTTPDLTGLPGVHIECKRVERLNVLEAMAQAERDAQRFQDGAPAVFHRRSRSPWLVKMKLEDWIKLYQGRDGGNE